MKRSNRQILISVLVFLLLATVATLAIASGEGEGAHHVDTGKQMKDFMWRCIDFAALFALIVWAIKKADMKKSLADRQAGIEKMLREADEARSAAEKKFAEYNTKLAEANKEIDQLQAAIRQEGQAEKERIIADARKSAEKIREQAKQAADQEVFKARAELREEAARLAVQLAEQKLKGSIRKDDQDRLVGDYLTKVVELH